MIVQESCSGPEIMKWTFLMSMCVQDALLCKRLHFKLRGGQWISFLVAFFRVAFSKPNVFTLFLVHSDQKNDSSERLVGFVFGNLLDTTETSNVQENLPQFPHSPTKL